MYWVKTPEFVQELFPKLLCRKAGDAPCLYLTFDDGPTPEITEWVLGLLGEYKALATFFCIGKHVETYPTLFKQIQQAGHQIGNHSYSHFNGFSTNNEVYLADVAKASLLIDSRLFRPPYGKLSWAQYQALQRLYTLVLWEVMPGDFDAKVSPERCLERILKNTRSDAIVVLHDSLKCAKILRFVLPKVLAHYANLGWKFLPL